MWVLISNFVLNKCSHNLKLDSTTPEANLETGYYESAIVSADTAISLEPNPTNPWDGHLVPIVKSATAKQTYYLSSLCSKDIWGNISVDNFFYVVNSDSTSASTGGAPGNYSSTRFTAPQITYDASSGILEVTPASLYVYLGGSNAPGSSTKSIATDIYLIK